MTVAVDMPAVGEDVSANWEAPRRWTRIRRIGGSDRPPDHDY